MTKLRSRLFFGVCTLLLALGFLSPNRLAGQTTNKVDLNTASEKDLDSLPGVGAATAKKIIAGRPYSSVDDLSKAGISAATVKKITPLVTASGGGAASAKAASPKASPAAASQPSPAAAGGKIDLNTASEKDLDSLPGVGPATAKKIIAGRPYSSVNDLSKAGVSAGTITKITPLVMASGAAAASAKVATPKASMPPAQPSPAAPSQAASQPAPAAAPAKAAATPASASASQGTPGPGTVWVNLASGVYHYPNSRYYGKTKSGKYMPESDAMKAGYHAAKDEKKPQ
jgi:DNA uptake protein ComE-like DNA-binding protein